ncbi:MAG: alanyl-tRNA editing protein [Oscillospiraceae bacterium]|nr:alanyl-tRNA editing protein [Oscillospiraceae bacterium]
METEKLFELDSHLTEFTARVRACEAAEGVFAVRLDRTAFYPEGGGQPWDLGTLGGVPVLAVRTRAGDIVHLCGAPLAPGETVEGRVDWARRLDLQQQHSGEHIVSGLIHAAYGYDNVGFHLGHDLVTIDLSGELTENQLLEIEHRANEAVWRDEPVRCFYPVPEELAALPYRSKKALTGAVRLVEFPGADLCACCGTHVKRTGEIGLIRLLSAAKFRGGTRVEMACGGRALSQVQAVWAQSRRISALLSAKPLETADAAERTLAALQDAQYRLTQLENRLFALQAEAVRGQGDLLRFEDGLAPDGARRLAAALAEASGGRAAVFSPKAEGGLLYAVCAPAGDPRPLCKAMNEALAGRGGGRPPLVQGSVQADEAAVRAFFDALNT